MIAISPQSITIPTTTPLPGIWPQSPTRPSGNGGSSKSAPVIAPQQPGRLLDITAAAPTLPGILLSYSSGPAAPRSLSR